MKDIFNNWRDFHSPDNTLLLSERLEEALSRRQFLKGGAIAALILSIMGSEYFKNMSDDHQDALLDAPKEELLDLNLTDPEYQKAVDEYYAEGGDFLSPKNNRPDLSGLSEKELKIKQYQAVAALMLAPEELPDGRPWHVAPVAQNRDSGYYAFAMEGDLISLSDTYPGFDKAISDAEQFYEAMPLTALWRYVFGQQAFFSYTSREDANSGKLFATIEIEQTQKDYFTGEEKKIKVNKLPLAWTVANKVMLDRITILEAELSDPELTRETYTAILEKHGVTPAYYKSKKMSPDEVVQNLITDGGTILSLMQQANPVPGSHSNQGELYIVKETLEEIC